MMGIFKKIGKKAPNFYQKTAELLVFLSSF